MSDIKCVVTKVSTILGNEKSKAQFKSLIATQWEEVDHRRKTDVLDVDFSQYLEMEELGIHFIVVAYTDECLVGYNSMLVSPSPHTRELTAATDTIFIKKEYRKAGIGSEMIKLAEQEARVRGAKHIMVTFKNDSPHPEIVKEQGFFSYETIYAKYIGE